jgi:hypothetical protein
VRLYWTKVDVKHGLNIALYGKSTAAMTSDIQLQTVRPIKKQVLLPHSDPFHDKMTKIYVIQ